MECGSVDPIARTRCPRSQTPGSLPLPRWLRIATNWRVACGLSMTIFPLGGAVQTGLPSGERWSRCRPKIRMSRTPSPSRTTSPAGGGKITVGGSQTGCGRHGSDRQRRRFGSGDGAYLRRRGTTAHIRAHRYAACPARPPCPARRALSLAPLSACLARSELRGPPARLHLAARLRH